MNEKQVTRPPGSLEETGQPVVPLFLNRKLWAAGNLAVPQEAGPRDERDALGAVIEPLSLTGHGAFSKPGARKRSPSGRSAQRAERAK